MNKPATKYRAVVTVALPRFAVGLLARRLAKDGLTLSQYFERLVAEDLKR